MSVENNLDKYVIREYVYQLTKAIDNGNDWKMHFRWASNLIFNEEEVEVVAASLQEKYYKQMLDLLKINED